jgi:hypothetical protein
MTARAHERYETDPDTVIRTFISLIASLARRSARRGRNHQA